MKTPYFIIIRGPLGSGKSTISEELSKKLKAEHISIDKILDEFKLTKDKEEGYISQRSFIKANEIAVERVKHLMKVGKPVIFDGNFYWKSQVEDLIERLREFNHIVFTLKAPLEVCINRDSKRNPPHGEMAATVVHKKTNSFDYGINIDVTKPLKESLTEIISHIK